MDPRIFKWILTAVILSILTVLTAPQFFSLFSEGGFQLRSTEEKTGRVNAPSKHDPQGMGLVPYYSLLKIEEKERKSKEIKGKKEKKGEKEEKRVTHVTPGRVQTKGDMAEEEKSKENPENSKKKDEKHKEKIKNKTNRIKKEIEQKENKREEKKEERNSFLSIFPFWEKPCAVAFLAAEKVNRKN